MEGKQVCLPHGSFEFANKPVHCLLVLQSAVQVVGFQLWSHSRLFIKSHRLFSTILPLQVTQPLLSSWGVTSSFSPQNIIQTLKRHREIETAESEVRSSTRSHTNLVKLVTPWRISELTFRALTLGFLLSRRVNPKQLNKSSRCLTYPHQLSVDTIHCFTRYADADQL